MDNVELEAVDQSRCERDGRDVLMCTQNEERLKHQLKSHKVVQIRMALRITEAKGLADEVRALQALVQEKKDHSRHQEVMSKNEATQLHMQIEALTDAVEELQGNNKALNLKNSELCKELSQSPESSTPSPRETASWHIEVLAQEVCAHVHHYNVACNLRGGPEEVGSWVRDLLVEVDKHQSTLPQRSEMHRCCEGALVDVLHKLDQLKEAAGRIGTSAGVEGVLERAGQLRPAVETLLHSSKQYGHIVQEEEHYASCIALLGTHIGHLKFRRWRFLARTVTNQPTLV